MSKKLKIYQEFNQGVYDGIDIDNVDEEELLQGYNIDLLSRGGYKQRYGYTLEHDFSSDSSPLTDASLELIMKPDVSGIFGTGSLIKTFGTYPGCNLYQTNSSGVTLIAAIAGSKLGREFFTNGIQYFVDGNEYYTYNWDTTAWAAVTPASGADFTDIRKCTFLIQRGQRMFALGSPDDPNYLFFSELGEPDNFVAGNSVNAISGEDDKLVAAAEYNEGLVVFREGDVWVWYGWDPTSDMDWYPLNLKEGTPARDSIIKAKDKLFYLGRDGIYALNTLEKNLTASVNVTPGIQEFMKTINWNYACNSKAVYYDGAYLIAVPTGSNTYPDTVIRVHLNLPFNTRDDEDSWKETYPCTLYTNIPVVDWKVDDSGDLNGLNSMYSFNYLTGYNDWGSGIPMTVQHRVRLYNSFYRNKIKSLILLVKQFEGYDCVIDVEVDKGYESNNYEIDVGVSEGWDAATWDSSYWDFDDLIKKEIKVGEKMDRVSFTITHNEADEPFLFYGFAVVFKPKKAKGGRDGITNI